MGGARVLCRKGMTCGYVLEPSVGVEAFGKRKSWVGEESRGNYEGAAIMCDNSLCGRVV